MELVTKSRKNIIIAIIGIFFCAIAIYWQSAFFDLVWDDYGVIIRNEKIRSLPAAFSTFYKRAGSRVEYDPAQMTASNWRPLRTVVHAVIYKCFQLEPFWYHLLNIIFHGLVAVMLFLVLLRITGDMLAAMIGALLFAVHPVNTEAVCWAKSLEDLMAAFFMLTSFLLILKLKNSKAAVKYNLSVATLACLAFAFAITAKLSVIFFPVFMLMFVAIQHWNRDKSVCRLVPRWSIGASLIMLAIAGGGVLARSTVLNKVAQSGYITGDCWTTWLSMPRIFLRYLRIELLPWPLFADYQNYPYAATMSDGVAWLYALIFIGLFAALSWLFIRKKLLAPWLWFWCALIPFSNIIAMKQLGAERFLYIPTLAVAWFGAELFKRFSAQPAKHPEDKTGQRLKLITATVLILFSLITLQRSMDWSSEIALWETTVAQFPNSDRPRQNLIKTYNRQQQPDQALGHAMKLAEQFPTRDNIVLFGYTLCLNRRYQPGIKILVGQKAHIVLNNAGAAAAQNGDLAAAERCFLLATSLAPKIAKYRTNLYMVRRQRQQSSGK
jgi:protein O-mannosyl-transferase